MHGYTVYKKLLRSYQNLTAVEDNKNIVILTANFNVMGIFILHRLICFPNTKSIERTKPTKAFMQDNQNVTQSHITLPRGCPIYWRNAKTSVSAPAESDVRWFEKGLEIRLVICIISLLFASRYSSNHAKMMSTPNLIKYTEFCEQSHC